RRSELRETSLDELERLFDVHAPREEEINFAGAARRDGTDARDAGDAVHRLLDGARDGDERLLRGHDAVVNDDDDAREVCGREEGDGQTPRSIKPSST